MKKIVLIGLILILMGLVSCKESSAFEEEEIIEEIITEIFILTGISWTFNLQDTGDVVDKRICTVLFNVEEKTETTKKGSVTFSNSEVGKVKGTFFFFARGEEKSFKIEVTLPHWIASERVLVLTSENFGNEGGDGANAVELRNRISVNTPYIYKEKLDKRVFL